MTVVLSRGAFISFEGGDGAGKSTQIARLAQSLRSDGRDVITTREPGGSIGAEDIRALLVRGPADRWNAKTEALLMYAARADHLERTINPARRRGAVVLTDRFHDSTMAYQGIAGALGQDAIDTLDRLVVGADAPDLTFVLDIDPALGMARANSRGGDDRFERKGIGYQGEVRAAFLAVAARAPDRCVVVDAGADADRIAQQIEDIVRARFKFARRSR